MFKRLSVQTPSLKSQFSRLTISKDGDWFDKYSYEEQKHYKEVLHPHSKKEYTKGPSNENVSISPELSDPTDWDEYWNDEIKEQEKKKDKEPFEKIKMDTSPPSKDLNSEDITKLVHERGVKLNHDAINVGGDEWNMKTAVRLETEWQESKPVIEKLLSEINLTPQDMTDEEAAEAWEKISHEHPLVDNIKESWKDTHYEQYYKTQVDNWRTGREIQNQAKKIVKDDFMAVQHLSEYPKVLATEKEALEDPNEDEKTKDFLRRHMKGIGDALERDKALVKEKNLNADWAMYPIKEFVSKHPEVTEEQVFDAMTLRLDNYNFIDNYQIDFPGLNDKVDLFSADSNKLRMDLMYGFGNRAYNVQQKIEPPKYLDEATKAELDSHLRYSMGAKDFYEYGIDQGYLPPLAAKLEPPKKYDPLDINSERTEGDGNKGDADYQKTQKIAKHLSLQRTMQLFKERGLIQDDSTSEQLKRIREHIAKMNHELWSDWKMDSSTLAGGGLIQVAAADELGGRLREYAPELRENVIAYADGFWGGYKAVKAYIRAEWETTQFLLEKAKLNKLQLYRGLNMKDFVGFEPYGDELSDHSPKYAEGYRYFLTTGYAQEDRHYFKTKEECEEFSNSLKPKPQDPRFRKEVRIPWGETPGNYTPFEQLPNLDLMRNGAASTTVKPSVANGWDGDKRVVLRIEVPRTAILSVPAYGLNYAEEKEVVITGTAWHGWDAWYGHAPEFKQLPRTASMHTAKESPKPKKHEIDISKTEYEKKLPHWLSPYWKDHKEKPDPDMKRKR